MNYILPTVYDKTQVNTAELGDMQMLIEQAAINLTDYDLISQGTENLIDLDNNMTDLYLTIDNVLKDRYNLSNDRINDLIFTANSNHMVSHANHIAVITKDFEIKIYQINKFLKYITKADKLNDFKLYDQYKYLAN